jgi:hypothetical protein
MKFRFKNPVVLRCVPVLMPTFHRLRFFIPALAIAVAVFSLYAEGNAVYLGRYLSADSASELSFKNKKNSLASSKFKLEATTLRKAASRERNNVHLKTGFLIQSGIRLSRLFDNGEIFISGEEFSYSSDYTRPISSRSPPLFS